MQKEISIWNGKKITEEKMWLKREQKKNITIESYNHNVQMADVRFHPVLVLFPSHKYTRDYNCDFAKPKNTILVKVHVWDWLSAGRRQQWNDIKRIWIWKNEGKKDHKKKERRKYAQNFPLSRFRMQNLG